MLLHQLLRFVHRPGVDKGVMLLTSRVSSASDRCFAGERCQLTLRKLTLAELDSFLKVVDLVFCILTVSFLEGLVSLKLCQVFTE